MTAFTRESDRFATPPAKHDTLGWALTIVRLFPVESLAALAMNATPDNLNIQVTFAAPAPAATPLFPGFPPPQAAK